MSRPRPPRPLTPHHHRSPLRPARRHPSARSDSSEPSPPTSPARRLRRSVAAAVTTTACLGALAVAAAPAGAHEVADGQVVVRPGDTLGELAVRHGTSVPALVAANGITDPDRILAGVPLRLPAGGTGPGGPRPDDDAGGEPGRHLVTWGETLGGIAARYGVDVDDLARWNGITDGGIYATSSLLLADPGPVPERSIACPVPGARFTNDWGFPRPGGRVHEGTDLFAPRGTPVRAPADGVVRTSEGRIGGLQVWLEEPTGDRWVGTHLDRPGAVGPVRAGAVIGTVGDSGNARGSSPQLHLELLPGGGDAVNAYPLLRQACG